MPFQSIKYIITAILSSLLLMTSCSAEIVPQAPTNQFIKGPFNLTTEWQTFQLNKPLEVLPHIHMIYLFLGDDYPSVNDVETTAFYNTNFGYKHYLTNQVIKPELILVDENRNNFQPTVDMTGWHKTPEGDYNFLGYGTNSDQGKFFYPKDTKFVAIKARANIAVKVSHFGWYAPWYYQAPTDTWDNVPVSEIVNLK